MELYVLGHDRSAAAISRFLDCYLPNRAPTWEEYPIPESADIASLILRTDIELLAYMEMHHTEPYGVYWSERTPATSLQTAMVFYTRDGAAILGLAGFFEDAHAYLRKFAEFTRAQYGWFTSEERPPDTAALFLEQWASRDPSTRIGA